MDNPLIRALRGRRSLARQVSGLGNDRLAEIAQHFEGRDGRRDRAFIRRDLEGILRNEQAMAPILARRTLQEQIRDPKTERSELGSLHQRLRDTQSAPGTVNASRNPLRWGSAARQRFGSLYRKT